MEARCSTRERSVLAPQTTGTTLLDAAAVLRSLGDRPRQLSSTYFYDAEGSRLFQSIMDLPEYYLTRVEREILEAHGGSIASAFAGESLISSGAISRSGIEVWFTTTRPASTRPTPLISPNQNARFRGVRNRMVKTALSRGPGTSEWPSSSPREC